jgi:hypothetical protein
MNLSDAIKGKAKQFVIGLVVFALLMLVLELRPAIISMLVVSILIELFEAVKKRTIMFNSLSILLTLLGALCAYLITLI